MALPMKRIWLLPLLTLALYGADVSGKWTGSVEVTDPTSGEKISTPVKAEFLQKGGEVSGTIGRNEDPEGETIRAGKLDGNNLVFEVQPAEATSAMKFTLVLAGDDRIEGAMEGAVDVGKISGKVVLSRVK
jgi:hypothetical protein